MNRHDLTDRELGMGLGINTKVFAEGLSWETRASVVFTSSGDQWNSLDLGDGCAVA